MSQIKSHSLLVKNIFTHRKKNGSFGTKWANQKDMYLISSSLNQGVAIPFFSFFFSFFFLLVKNPALIFTQIHQFQPHNSEKLTIPFNGTMVLLSAACCRLLKAQRKTKKNHLSHCHSFRLVSYNIRSILLDSPQNKTTNMNYSNKKKKVFWRGWTEKKLKVAIYLWFSCIYCMHLQTRDKLQYFTTRQPAKEASIIFGGGGFSIHSHDSE